MLADVSSATGVCVVLELIIDGIGCLVGCHKPDKCRYVGLLSVVFDVQTDVHYLPLLFAGFVEGN